MSETPNPAPKKNTFGASVSFDLDKAPEPKRWEKKNLEEEQPPMPVNTPSLSADVNCPGCGNGLSEEEWLDALVGFVSGVRDFELGNPVRARIVQTLRNTVTTVSYTHLTLPTIYSV